MRSEWHNRARAGLRGLAVGLVMILLSSLVFSRFLSGWWPTPLTWIAGSIGAGIGTAHGLRRERGQPQAALPM